MPFGEVTLIPGVNVERTPTLLQASFFRSQFIRFKDSLVQKFGGWQKFFPSAVSGTVRDLHAWSDLNSNELLAYGSTNQLGVIANGSLTVITPQTITTDFAPNFTTVSGSPLVEILDANISNVTTYDAVYFNTPVSVGGIILSGLYQIFSVTGVNSYKVTAAMNATAIVNNGGAVPVFTTVSGSALVSVLLANHGQVVGNNVIFPVSTTGNGITIFQHYPVISITDANNFSITASSQANASSSFPMNSGNAEIVYYISLGPPAAGSGYGLGGYGDGGYGTGTSSSSQTGTAITAVDWEQDNWGEILLASPEGGGIYSYDPNGGFTTASLIATAPIFNNGIFVSTTQQILFGWGSSEQVGIGVQQDPMLISWSNSGDYTDFVPLETNQAGSFRIPIGSQIVSGMAAVNQNLFWTDLDLWAANYIGPPLVYSFNKIGAGAGLISSHAAQQLRGSVFWMGKTNFYSLTGNGVAVIPCPVWDAVFQDLDQDNAYKIRAMPNTPYNEVGWFYPSNSSPDGENDSYVKFNITEPGLPWDIGSLPRSAWMDQTILGPPIGTNAGGLIYQHETTNDADGQPLVPAFTTGYFYIAEGEDFVLIDEIYPDFKWGEYGGSQSASVDITFNVVNYPNDTPEVYGPFTVNSSTQYVSTRIRGRQMSISMTSTAIGIFWRIGKVRYRYRPDGRR